MYKYYKKVLSIYQTCKKKNTLLYFLQSKPIDHGSKYPSYTIIPQNKEINYIDHYRKFVKILKNKKMTLWNWLKELFIKDCTTYHFFINTINSDIYGILYNNKIVKNPFFELFLTLEIYKDCIFVQKL